VHHLELVANDIRFDREGQDIELMSIPWYSQTPKDITIMYATCSYGKQYEELLHTTDYLDKLWYAMVKFDDTLFAQYALKGGLDPLGLGQYTVEFRRSLRSLQHVHPHLNSGRARAFCTRIQKIGRGHAYPLLGEIASGACLRRQRQRSGDVSLP
jgi:hypothetical protein